MKKESDLLVERTRSELARAKKKDKTLGRLPKTTLEQRTEIVTSMRRKKALTP
jgi:DNA invertase Pin-like site-specific DNA recombinase